MPRAWPQRDGGKCLRANPRLSNQIDRVDRLPRGALFERLSNCAPQHDRKPLVELGACPLRQRIPLPCPGERVRERADADREREGAGETATPRLEIRVAQPCEPRVGWRQLVDLLEEPERDDKGREGVRDRRVAPIE